MVVGKLKCPPDNSERELLQVQVLLETGTDSVLVAQNKQSSKVSHFCNSLRHISRLIDHLGILSKH
jgi:hypothetical protein